jgi:hypothetical protein
MNYISTCEDGEKIDNAYGLLPATVKHKELMADKLSVFCTEIIGN